MNRLAVLLSLLMCLTLTVSANFPANYNAKDDSEDVVAIIANKALSSEFQREVPIDDLDDHGVLDDAVTVDKEVAEVFSRSEGDERMQLSVSDSATDRKDAKSADINKFLKTWTLDLRWKSCLRKGMTWRRRKYFCHSHGTGMVGCAGCDAYRGDTICWNKRPILCINDQNMQRPDYVAGTGTFGFYYGWSGAHIDITKPIRGCWIQSRYHADLICKMFFGDCWRMAEFHDGWYQTNLPATRQGAFCEWQRNLRGGWNFYAYGNRTGNVNFGRFWVAINDQRANCWDWP